MEFFKYLGSFVSWGLRETTDVAERIKEATKAFGAVQNNLYGNNDITLHLPIRWFKAIVINVLLWGCDIWAFAPIQVKKIQVFYRRCIQYMLRITVFHKVRNDALLELASVDDVILTVRLRQCR